jgi:hypothetical protein
LVVELIRLRYRLRSEQDQKNVLERIRERFRRDKNKSEAINYLTEWAGKFWEDTELRIHEVTRKLEEDMRASLGAKASLLVGSSSAGKKYSLEERQELVHRAQAVVNEVQISKLNQVIKILAEDIFDDPQKNFYICIDRLDENWVGENLRYRLIKALLEAIKDLRIVRSAKIIIALRRDLLDRVFRQARGSGFQEEKYQQYFLELKWSPEQLFEVVERRLNRLVQRQYSGGPVHWQDLLPQRIGKEPTKECLIERTLRRPRDIIQFINCGIGCAVDRPEITATMVREAEAEYSRLRFRSLGDEWASDYPHLLDVAVSILKSRPASFRAEDVTNDDLEKLALIVIDLPGGDRLHSASERFLEEKMTPSEYRRSIIKVLCEVGMCGLKTAPGQSTSWSFIAKDTIRDSDISDDARIEVSPMLHRALSINIRSR